MNLRVILLSGVLATGFASGLAGCASSIDSMRDTVASAPDWYDARRAEVRGEGYPDVGRVPQLTNEQASTSNLQETRADIAATEVLFLMDPRAVPPGLELDEMLDWARQVKAEATAYASEPGNHLTPEDVDQLRAIFETRRAAAS